MKSSRTQLLLIPLLAGACLTASLSSAEDRHIGPVTDIAEDGDRLYSVSQGGIFEGLGPGLKRLVRPPFRVTSLAVAGKQLLLGGGKPGQSGMIALYDIRSRKIRSLELAEDLIYDVAVHPDGRTAACACADGRVMMVGLPDLLSATLRERHRHTAAARSVAFSPDGKHLGSGGLDALLFLSRTDGDGKAIQMQDHSAMVDCLVFSPDSKWLASGARDGKVRIHNTDGRLVRTHAVLSDADSTITQWESDSSILALVWGVGEPFLVAGSASGSLFHSSGTDTRWTKSAVAVEGPVYSLAFEGKGTLVIGARDVQRHASGNPSP